MIPRLYGICRALALLTVLVSPALAGDLPDSRLTPGDTLPGVTAAEVCEPGWARQHRKVPTEVRNEVYAAYGLPDGNYTGYCDTPHGCELDHLVPLELGGSNSARNLWPQSYDGPMSAHAKDKLENRLHQMVCTGSMTLEDAQQAIATDWIAAHRRYVQGVTPTANISVLGRTLH